MVKGVNKNVIEVNSTGSEMFEKIVFYVSPKFSGLGAKSLEKATDEIEKTLLLTSESGNSLRLRVKNKEKRRKIIMICGASSVLLSLIVLGLFKLLF